jgi:hypothetical protein
MSNQRASSPTLPRSSRPRSWPAGVGTPRAPRATTESEPVTDAPADAEERTIVETPWHSIFHHGLASEANTSVAGEIDVDTRSEGLAELDAAPAERVIAEPESTCGVTSSEEPTVRSELLEFFVKRSAASDRGEPDERERTPGLGQLARDAAATAGRAVARRWSAALVALRGRATGATGSGGMGSGMASRAGSGVATVTPAIAAVERQGRVNRDRLGAIVGDVTARTQKTLLLVGSIIVLAVAACVVTVSVLGAADQAVVSGSGRCRR